MQRWTQPSAFCASSGNRAVRGSRRAEALQAAGSGQQAGTKPPSGLGKRPTASHGGSDGRGLPPNETLSIHANATRRLAR